MPALDLSLFGVETNRRPISARITLGRQPPDKLGAAYPIAKDRFWICSPIADGVKVEGRGGTSYTQHFLPLHKDYARFNHDPFLNIEQFDDAQTGAILEYAATNPPGLKDRRDVPPVIDRALAALPEAARPTWGAAMNRHRESRRLLRGNVVHRHYLSAPATPDDAGFLRRAAQGGSAGGIVLTPHPKKLPACICSDGVTAKRWRNANGGEYFETPCGGDRCPLANPNPADKGKQHCGKTLTLGFQLRWPALCWRCQGTQPSCPECHGSGTAPALPSATCEIECSGPFNIAANAISGFFADVDREWAAMGLPADLLDYYGLPFTLGMAHKIGAGKDYYTVYMAPDFDPGVTFQQWAIVRAQRNAQGRAQIVGDQVLALPGETDSPRATATRRQIATLQEIPGTCE